MSRPKKQESEKRAIRSVSMHTSTRKLAKQIGYGSISKGIEIAVVEMARARGIEIDELPPGWV